MAEPDDITATEFKARGLELMDNVATRRVSDVVTKRGRAVAPVDEVSTGAFGFMRGTVIEHDDDDIVAPNHARWGDVCPIHLPSSRFPV